MAVAILAILLIGSIGIYMFLNVEEEKEEKEETKVIELDDRISPLVNQGLVLEVQRIRHRGLYDALTSAGNSWKTAPTFYFISDMDGLEYVSKDIAQHSTTATVYFNTWDSMFEENKIVKDADEEQEESTVTLQLVEVVPTGILGRRTTDVVRDEFTVTYDYRTGRWSGDDYFMDNDGYGYYLGDTFEVWFNLYQMDYDRDYIPYWTEVNVLGTDPTVDDSNLDPDNDGVPTDWEWRWGYDPFTWDDHYNLDPDIDGLENTEEYMMSKWFADPYIQNVYVEVDFMEAGGVFDHVHIFPVECQQGIIEKYAENNIKLIFDDGWPDGPSNGGGQEVPYIKQVSQDSGMISQYYYHYFAEERQGVFRYLLIGNEGGFNHPAIGNFYDCTFIPDYITKNPVKNIKNLMNRGIFPTIRRQYVAFSAAAMHELGHSIGLSNVDFEGIDNMSYRMWFYPSAEFKDTYYDYVSVMNYYWMYKPSVLDYSHGTNGAPYDQDDWEQLFVATFQYNNKYVEEANIDEIPTTIYSEEGTVEGYTFNETLTEEFIDMMGASSPVDPIPVDWKVLVKDDDNINLESSDIKVFVEPKTPAAYWVLSCEGDFDSEGNMVFYSQEEVFQPYLEMINK